MSLSFNLPFAAIPRSSASIPVAGASMTSSEPLFDSKAFLSAVTHQSGVYRMYDSGGTVIYVGKARI